MPTYLALHRRTTEGAETIGNARERLQEAKALAESMDCRIENFLVTNGRYDVAVVFEAPDGETAKQLSMAVTSGGTVTTELQRAFTEDEYDELLAGLPER